MKIRFCGAARSVTGSCHMISANGKNVLVDCGMRQGADKKTELGEDKFPFNPAEIDAVLLTHAHIDHSGLIPLLVKQGFKGSIIATDATAQLSGIMLPDSGHIQEQEAEYQTRKNLRAGKAPAEPLYTVQDAQNALKQFTPTSYGRTVSVVSGITARFNDIGHLLGSSAIEIWVEENGITLHFDGSGDTLQLDLTISGDLMDLTNGGSLFPVEAIQSSVPYFTRNGLEMNAEVELGTFLLANGASSYSGEGNGYRRSDCYWEVTKKADDIHNGIRDLHFDAICYIPESAISTAANGTVVVSSELYDAYTGMWLTAGSTFNNSSRGDNYYLHTVSWRGNSYLIEFTYSTDWNFQVGDWGAVLTKSYSVYMPADYDGLVFAAQAEPDTYQESARKMQLDSISPEACVLDLDTLEPYSSLYFSLCD